MERRFGADILMWLSMLNLSPENEFLSRLNVRLATMAVARAGSSVDSQPMRVVKKNKDHCCLMMSESRKVDYVEKVETLMSRNREEL